MNYIDMYVIPHENDNNTWHAIINLNFFHHKTEKGQLSNSFFFSIIHKVFLQSDLKSGHKSTILTLKRFLKFKIGVHLNM